MRKNRLLLLAILPAISGVVIFELFLGHRHDYSGHYVAGYGATFAAAMFGLRILDRSKFQQRATRMLIPFCFACIAGGAIAEATVFRLARFDEIDFCNQSIGAVLATVCASGYIRLQKCADEEYDYGLIAGIAFLGLGGCLAVA
jgi:hypothetical protein